jgi:hypothetical protein
MAAPDGLIQPHELASIREAALVTLPDLCDITRGTVVDDEYGSASPGESFVEAGVPCSVTALSQFRVQGGGTLELAEVLRFSVTFPLGTDVEPGDTLHITSLGGNHLHVDRVLEPESWDVLFRAEATRVEDV